MTDRDYLPPALAALAAAAGLPLLWVFDLMHLSLGGEAALAGGPGFGDVLFLVLGACMAWAYWSLRRSLTERLNYRSVELPLRIMVGLTVAFHLGFFVLALAGVFLSEQAVLMLTMTYWIPFLVLFGLTDIVIGIVLLRDRDQLPTLFTALGAMSVLLGLVELSVFFSPAALVLLPLVLVLVALCLVHRPDVLEVV